MTSAFDQFRDPTVAATVSAENGASELYLIDPSFNEVARGVGRLHSDLVPGPYRVRERIGDCETVSGVFEVGFDKDREFKVRGVPYESALPLAGTATNQCMPQLGPLRSGSGVRIVVRDPGACDAAQTNVRNTSMMEEIERLRIETFTSDPAATMTEGAILANDNGLFAIDIDLRPGSYILVHEFEGGRRVCMSLYVMPDWNPAVYLLMPSQTEAAGGKSRLKLAEASLFYMAAGATEPPGDIELARLEAARHALSRARPIGGWALLPPAPGQAAPNPLMDLIDAYLLLPRAPNDAGKEAAALIDRAAAAFGKEFPDVHAARLAYAQALGRNSAGKSDSAALAAVERARQFTTESLYGPPILARSWRHLLDAYNGRKSSAVILPFEFSVEPSESWFVWSEYEGARSPARASSALGALLEKATSAELLKLARDIFERVARSDESVTWVRQVQELAGREAGRVGSVFRDPSMQRIVAALAMVSDPILQKALGQQELVDRAWASLKVSNEVLYVTLRKLTGVLAENKLLAGLSIVIGGGLLATALALLRSSNDSTEEK
jgi:hypothetical protein